MPRRPLANSVAMLLVLFSLGASRSLSAAPLPEPELRQHDEGTGAWTRKADCPGGGPFLPAAFAIEDKAYFGTGGAESGAMRDL